MIKMFTGQHAFTSSIIDDLAVFEGSRTYLSYLCTRT